MADEIDEASEDTTDDATAGDADAGEPVEAEATDVTADEGSGEASTSTDTATPGKATKATKATESSGSEKTVVRRQVTSRRVTPKGGAAAAPTGPKKPGAKGHPVESSRYTPPADRSAYGQGPSPWWVPALMFGLFIVGAAIIMLNYMNVFGDAANLRLVIGLGFILAGIITATQYR